MKKIIAFLGTFIMLYSSYGHTCAPKTVKCPIDNNTVEFCVSMSMTTFGSYYDFQKKGAVGSHYEELINSCSKCHYSGYLSDFEKTLSNESKEELKQFLAKYDKVEINDAIECKIAGELKERLNAKNDEVSNCYLIGSYLLRSDSNNTELRREFQSLTKTFLLKAVEKNEYKDSSMIATINYLIAEMYRRTGEFNESVSYFDKAINDQNKQDWIMEVATKQKELAIKEDDNNEI